MKGVIEASGLIFVRCGFIKFSASTLDFDIEFDSDTPEFAAAFEGRHKVGIGLIRMCAEHNISIPYPTQVSMTAAPDGKLIMPYPESDSASH